MSAMPVPSFATELDDEQLETYHGGRTVIVIVYDDGTVVVIEIR